MITQLIFFLAVVLALIILIRRAKIGASNSGQGWSKYLNILGQSLAGLFSSAGAALKKINRRSFSKKPTGEIFNSTGEGEKKTAGRFWQSEGLSEQYELASHFEEGDSLLKSGKYQEAEQYFLKAASNNPSDPKVYAKLGLIYLNQENYSDAIESLKIAAKYDKHNPSRHYNLALAYWGNNDIQKAIMSVRDAIGLDPVTPKYRQLLEQLLNRQEKKTA